MVLAAASLAAAVVAGHGLRQAPLRIDKQQAHLTVKADSLRFFSVGMKRALADLIWVKTLIDGDLEHYGLRDLNSWMYLRFRTIAQLDPMFYEVYRHGGQYLSIVKDDLEGAETLMRDGLALFPNDYHLNWQMGFLISIELQDPARSFPFFERIKDHPLRPPFFDSFFTKITAHRFGDREAFLVALELYKRHPEGDPLHERLGHYLYQLKAGIDLACLNGGEANCETQDFDGQPYLRGQSGWFARKTVAPLRLKAKKGGDRSPPGEIPNQ